MCALSNALLSTAMLDMYVIPMLPTQRAHRCVSTASQLENAAQCAVVGVLFQVVFVVVVHQVLVLPLLLC